MTQNEFNPYIGPRPFEREKEDTTRFFGRKHETEEIISFIYGHPITLVYAQSGAGKTSLFNASIAPKLEENGFEVLPLTRVGGVIPKEISPNEINNLYIFNALLKMDPEIDPKTLVSQSLPSFLETQPRINDEDDQPHPRVVIFDQFEELFTYTMADWQEQRESFFHQIVEALNADPLLRVVFVIREDFLAELDPYARALPERLRIRYRLERLGESAALQAIKDPLTISTRKFAPGVAEDLVKELLVIQTVDATGKTAEIIGQYVEPVQLQVVCVTFWSKLEPGVTEIQQIHLKDFNVSDALVNFYESAVRSATTETGIPEVDIRNWFGKTLITSLGTRSTVFGEEMSTDSINKSVVDFLERQHIIRAEVRAGARWYELTHDRLIKPVLDSNKIWFEQNLSAFQKRVVLWVEQGRSESLLLGEKELAESKKEASTRSLTKEEKEFRKESEKQVQRLQRDRAQQRIISVALIVAVVLLVFFVVASFFASRATKEADQARATAQYSADVATTKEAEAIKQKAIAEEQRTEAEKQKAFAEEQKLTAEQEARRALAGNLAAEADSQKGSNYPLALLLSAKAHTLESTLLTRTTLFDLLQFTPSTRLFGYGGPVTSLAVSPDGEMIASASCREYNSNNQCKYGEIVLTNTVTHQLIRKIDGEYGFVNSLVFGRSGDTLLLAAGGCVPLDDKNKGCTDNKGQITLWDVTNSTEPKLVSEFDPKHTASVQTIAFSHNGFWLASGSLDTKVILWDVRDPAKPAMLGNFIQGHTSYVYSVDFSNDDKILASAGDDLKIFLWDISNPNTVTQIGSSAQQHTATINSIAFSPDGTKFASASNDFTVVLWTWNASTQRLESPQTLSGHDSFVKSIAFNADGSILASTGFDSQVIVWDTSTGSQMGLPFSGHTKAINAIAFSSPQGGSSQFLFSGGNDRIVIQWDLSSRHPLSQPVTTVTEPDGIGMEATSGSNTARVENEQQIILNGQILQNGHTGTVNSLHFGMLQDGRLLLASASDDQTVILWDVSNIIAPIIFLKLEGFDNPLKMAFFDNGQLVTIEKNSNRAIRWDIDPSNWESRVCEDIALIDTQIAEWNRLVPDQTYQETCRSIP